MFWFGIQSVTDIWKETRHKIGDVINYIYNTSADLISILSQKSQNFKQNIYVGNKIPSDRSLIKKSDISYMREKRSSRILHRTVSQYWKNALYSHWLIIIQCLILVIFIILIAPWIGSDCNNDYEVNYLDHKPISHLRQFRKVTDKSKGNLLTGKSCFFMSLFSSGSESSDKLYKRSSILRRKRVDKNMF